MSASRSSAVRSRSVGGPAQRATWRLGAISLLLVAAIVGLFAKYGANVFSSGGSSDYQSGDEAVWEKWRPVDRSAESDTGAEYAALRETKPERRPTANDRSDLELKDIPFDGAAAYEYLKQVCAIGPRRSGSAGMRKQQELLVAHFKKLGAKIELQRFQTRHPLDGSVVPLANLIVTWHPERRERVLLCCHYDTRPYPENDPNPAKRKSDFIGANDGASSVGLLMQLGKSMPKVEGKVGVDFVFFDAEELVYEEGGFKRGDYFIGSYWFANEYKRKPPKHKYRAGILLDMVADAELHLYKDRHSLAFPAARPIVEEVWKLAAELEVREFIDAKGHLVQDDHLMLNEFGGIPTIDIIDFDYPRPGDETYWHTTSDVPENCSALSLAKVGWVVEEWLKRTVPK
ncbi:MAG: peptidase M28 [Planctomycetota bacterium]|nr:MAG: peptidase M28 [Planctomycetota bacterium]